jgi:Arc/MetJ-type ribon-helix-helix transcriptional regulator
MIFFWAAVSLALEPARPLTWWSNGITRLLPGCEVVATAVKVAVSVPSDLFRAVESARKRSRQSRSAAIQEALRQWLRTRAQVDLVREYEAGYRNRPEDQVEIDRALKTAVDAFPDEDEW